MPWGVALSTEYQLSLCGQGPAGRLREKALTILRGARAGRRCRGEDEGFSGYEARSITPEHAAHPRPHAQPLQTMRRRSLFAWAAVRVEHTRLLGLRRSGSGGRGVDGRRSFVPGIDRRLGVVGWNI